MESAKRWVDPRRWTPDWLNGEIVLLGRAHGVQTPVNDALRRLANRLAREGRPPGSLSIDEVEAEVAGT